MSSSHRERGSVLPFLRPDPLDGHAFRLVPGVVVFLLSLLSSGALLSQDPRYPHSLREAGLDHVLRGGMKPEEGFRVLTGPKPMVYILDPGLDIPTSHCYRPHLGSARPRDGAPLLEDLVEDADLGPVPRPESAQSLTDYDEKLEALLEDDEDQPGPGLAIANEVREVFDDFFRDVCEQRQVWSSFSGFLRKTSVHQRGDTWPLFAVGMRFWIDSADRKKQLTCRVDLRLFRLRLERPFEEARYADLARCELIFRDAAVARVPAEMLGDSLESARKAVQAVVIEALRNGIAVNLCLNPQIDHTDPVQKLGTKVCGEYSISQYVRRRN